MGVNVAINALLMLLLIFMTIPVLTTVHPCDCLRVNRRTL